MYISWTIQNTIPKFKLVLEDICNQKVKYLIKFLKDHCSYSGLSGIFLFLNYILSLSKEVPVEC